MEIIIRKATSADSDEIEFMMLDFEDHMELTNPNVWRITDSGRSEIHKHVKDLFSDIRQTFVAEGEDVIGFASAHVIRRANFNPGTIGFIDMIYVKEEHRRKRVALKLLSKITDYFIKENVNEVNLRYVVGNTVAETLWSELGMQSVLLTVNASLAIFTERLQEKQR